MSFEVQTAGVWTIACNIWDTNIVLQVPWDSAILLRMDKISGQPYRLNYDITLIYNIYYIYIVSMINCHIRMLYVIYKQLNSSFNDMHIMCILFTKSLDLLLYNLRIVWTSFLFFCYLLFKRFLQEFFSRCLKSHFLLPYGIYD